MGKTVVGKIKILDDQEGRNRLHYKEKKYECNLKYKSKAQLSVKN